MGPAMSKRRRMTEDEKAEVSVWAHEREARKHPGAVITIEVDDEIDDEGRVHYRTIATTESVVALEDLPE
jgi:hypothetical protein